MNRPPFTLEEHAGIARVLEAAKCQLWNGTDDEILSGKQKFLCHAIDKAARWVVNHVEFNYYLLAKERVIQERLGSHYSFESWLHSRHVSRCTSVGTGNPKLMQAHRLAWLNQLIEEFSMPEKEAVL